MNCPLENQEGSALLLAYSANRLESEKAVPMQRHLESCPACRRFVENQSAVWEALDMWKAEPVSADFDRRLYARIEQQVSWWDMLLRPFRPLVTQGLPLAAAAGVLIMAGVLLDRQAPVPVVPPQQSAQVEALQPDQVEHAIDEVEMLNRFNHLMRSDPADPNSKM